MPVSFSNSAAIDSASWGGPPTTTLPSDFASDSRSCHSAGAPESHWAAAVADTFVSGEAVESSPPLPHAVSKREQEASASRPC
jgi:hypothetical protein